MNVVEKPLVSVVINNYNYGSFLRSAISSALQQSYAPVEVIVVDDGSTDDSRQIMESYGKHIVAVMKENGGQASALNAGFARSQGEIIIFLDADDLLLPDTVDQVVNRFAVIPHAARVHYRLEVVDTSCQPIGMLVPPAYLSLASGDLQKHLPAMVNGTNWSPTSGNAFAAGVLRRILPMPEAEFRVDADYYLLRASALCGTVAALEEVGAYYRLHRVNHYLRADLNLQQLRQQIVRTRVACKHLQAFAERVGASIDYELAVEQYDEIHLAQRMISLKLAPEKHPLEQDTLFSLFRKGTGAAWQRPDLSLPLKIVHLFWFGAMYLMPRLVATSIAQQLLPGGRISLILLLKMLQLPRKMKRWPQSLY